MVLGFRDLFPFLDTVLIDESQKCWDSDPKGRFYYNIEPMVSFSVKYFDKNTSKQTDITRLRFGKCLLNNTLAIMKKHDQGNYDFCYIKEDGEHFLMDCIDFQHFQVNLIDKILKKIHDCLCSNTLEKQTFL